jgi:hypothetical protein
MGAVTHVREHLAPVGKDKSHLQPLDLIVRISIFFNAALQSGIADRKGLY